MRARLQPVRFESYLRPMPWGGTGLGRFLGKNLPPGQPIGEAWELSDHPHHISRVDTVFWHGLSLRDIMTQFGPGVFGDAPVPTCFPWLVKFLDAADKLSVQVHPDDAAAKTLWPGEAGKTECWLVLDAQPGSVVHAGLKPGVGAREFTAAARRGDIANLLHAFTPRPGDVVFLPAGTVHAVGGGVVFAEIQQTSDATFRLFDWNRVDATGKPRELHVEQALACINWNTGPVTPRRLMGNETLVACEHFEVAGFHQLGRATLGGANQLMVLVVTEGQGRFANGEFLMAGDAWLLPASMEPMLLEADPVVQGLLCRLPRRE